GAESCLGPAGDNGPRVLRAPRLGRRLYHRHDGDGSAVQEGIAGAAKSRTRVRVSRVRDAARDRGGRRDRAGAESAAARRQSRGRAAANPVVSRRRSVRARSRAARGARAARAREAPRPPSPEIVMPSSYLAHGATLALAWFLSVNLVASIGA